MKLNKTTGLNYNTSNLRVCVDSVQDSRISGRVYSMRLSVPISFSDISDFVLKVESVLDAQNFPQAFQRKRVFTGEASAESPYVADDEGLDEQTVASAKGEVCTFSVQILTRMNTTWQGVIDWLDGGEKARFMSVLQFLELVDKKLAPLE